VVALALAQLARARPSLRAPHNITFPICDLIFGTRRPLGLVGEQQ
jgi:hypothetical protein